MRYAVIKDQVPYKFTNFHNTITQAKDEAMRLCQKEQHPFFIIKVLGNVHLQKPIPPVLIEWERDCGESYGWR